MQCAKEFSARHADFSSVLGLGSDSLSAGQVAVGHATSTNHRSGLLLSLRTNEHAR